MINFNTIYFLYGVILSKSTSCNYRKMPELMEGKIRNNHFKNNCLDIMILSYGIVEESIGLRRRSWVVLILLPPSSNVVPISQGGTGI